VKARYTLIQHQTERIHVAAFVSGLAIQSFGGNIGCRPDNLSVCRLRRWHIVAGKFGRSKIENLRTPVIDAEYVLWLQIPMNNVDGVCRCNAHGYACHEFE